MTERALNAEEIFALRKILVDEEVLREFVEKYAGSATVSREATGVGFFSTITFPSAVPATERNQWDWNFSHAHLRHGGSFICYREGPNGLGLEGVVHEGEWPDDFSAEDFADAKQ